VCLTWCAGDFKERRTIKLTPQASAAEESAYRALLAIRFAQGGIHGGGKQQELQRVAMQKAIFSSPFAALESTQKRIQLLIRARQPTADEQQPAGRRGVWLSCPPAGSHAMAYGGDDLNHPSGFQLRRWS
jgi:hypothetical protein